MQRPTSYQTNDNQNNLDLSQVEHQLYARDMISLAFLLRNFLLF